MSQIYKSGTGGGGGGVATVTAGANINLTGTGTNPIVNLNNQILEPNGTAGAPSYSFATDPTSGMYLDGGGFLAFSSLGSEKFKLGSGGAFATSNLSIASDLNISAFAAAVSPFSDPSGGTYFGITSLAAPFSFILNSASSSGRIVMIKDEVGTASTNNITITATAGLIDGAASKVINTNYGSLMFVFRNNNWWSVQ